jgi:hypothetical protein
MPTEYVQHRRLSEKTDAYALGIVLLELLTGLYHMRVVEPMYDSPDFFKCAYRLADTRAGEWPARASKGLAAVAERCCELRVHDRATVRAARPQLEALLAARRRWGGMW